MRPQQNSSFETICRFFGVGSEIVLSIGSLLPYKLDSEPVLSKSGVWEAQLTHRSIYILASCLEDDRM
jgi:hypothetical protein